MAGENTKPELRHEFIAMVFAFVVGDVGLQLAPLVKLGWVPALLPAYTHLILATVVIATSFVGWTQSPSAGGRRDVKKVLELEFIILLIDMLLVLMYFMLVRAYDFTSGEDGKSFTYTADAAPEAGWIIFIFAVYLVWDFVAKVFIVDRTSDAPPKKFCERVHDALPRMIPTVLSLGIAIVSYFVMRHLKPARVIIADATLIFLILLFRAFKDFASAFYSAPPNKPPMEDMRAFERRLAEREYKKLLVRWPSQVRTAKCAAVGWSAILLLLIAIGWIVCCISRPILPRIEDKINATVASRVSMPTAIDPPTFKVAGSSPTYTNLPPNRTPASPAA